MPANQSAAELGVEHSSLDIAGASLLARHFYLVVRGRYGLLDLKHFGGYVACWLGCKLRQ